MEDKQRHAAARTESPSNWTSRITLWHAVALGVAVRIAVLLLLPDQNFPDANTYQTSGRELFATGFMADHAYMPLYPIWTYLTGGGTTLRLADIALSVASIWLIFELTLELFADRRAALLAAFAAALWPHFAFYAVSGLTETAYTFILLLAFLLLYRQKWLAAICLLVLSILIRPALEMFVPVLLVLFAIVVHRIGVRRTVGKIALLGVVYVLFMAPWWVHQQSKYGQFVRLNLGLGMVLYSGNNPTNRSGGGVGYSGANYHKSDHNPAHPAWAVKDPIARDRALKQAAFDFISDNPGRFIALAGVKFLRFWRLWPYAEAYKTIPIILASLLSYGVMLLAALLFLFRHFRAHWRGVLPIIAICGFLTAVHMVTIGSIRYRFPLEPFLIILGCYAISQIVQSIGRRLSGR